MRDTIEVIEQIDLQCDLFEQAWKQGTRPELEQYLVAFDPPIRNRAFPHLLSLELDYLQRADQVPRYEDYVRRFPEYKLLIDETFQLHTLSGSSSSGESPPVRRHFTAALLGTLQDRYDVIRESGRGGMGVVYQAREIATGRIVALKLLSLHPLWDEPDSDRLLRFEQEIRLAAQLEHDHIVRVYEVGRVEGHPYFSMQWIDGMNLSDRLELGPLDNHAAARLIQVVAETIHYAHQSGVIHRDLKPQNILLDRRHKAYVADFGLAKSLEGVEITQTHEVIGSPAYMAPEQVTCEPVDARSDVYSLGVTLYQCLTGRVPFQAASGLELLRQVSEDAPVAPRRLNRSIAPELDSICLKCLEKHPQRRYQSAGELAADLGRFLSAEPVRAKPVGTLTRSWRWVQRHPGMIGWMTALFLVGVIAAASLFFWAQAERRRRDQATLQVRLALQTANLLAEEASTGPLGDPSRLVESRLALKSLGPVIAEFPSIGYLQREVNKTTLALQRRSLDHSLLDQLETSRFKAAWSLRLKPEPLNAVDASGRLSYQFQLQPLAQYHHEVFLEHGFDPEQPLETVIAKIERRPDYVRAMLLAALNEAYIASFSDREQPHPAQEFWGQVLQEVDLNRWRSDYRAAVRANKYQRVLELAKTADPAEGGSLLVFVWLGQELATHGYADLGLDLLGRLEAQHPGNFWVRHALAAVHLHSDNFTPSESLRQATAAVAVRPVPIAYLLQGYAFLETGRPQQAKARFEKVLQLQPETPLAQYGIGSATYQAGNLHASEQAYRQFLKSAPESAMGLCGLAKVQARRRDFEAALETLDQAIELAPNWWMVHQQRGQVLYYLLRYAPAADAFRKAKQLAPSQTTPDLMLGLCLIRMGDWQEGYTLVQQADQQRKLDAGHCLLVGQACSRKHHHSEARYWMHRGYTLEPKNPQVLLSLGAEHCDHFLQIRPALDYFRQLLSQENPPREVYQNLAVAYTRQGRPAEAAQYAKQAIAAGLATPMMICLRAQNLRDAGLFQAGLDVLQQATVQQFPAKFQGRADFLTTDLTRLLEVAEQLKSNQLGDDFETLCSAARVCYYQRKYRRAAEYYAQAKQLQPRQVGQTLGYQLRLAIWLRAGTTDEPMALRPQKHSRTDYRDYAYELMQQDLHHFETLLQQEKPRDRRMAWQILRQWQEREEYAGVREPSLLMEFPEAERARWQTLWEDAKRLEQKFQLP